MLTVFPSDGLNLSPPKIGCPRYDTKPSNGEAWVLKFWGMWSTSSMSLLPGLLWLRMVVPVKVSSMGQIDLFENY